MTLDTDTAWELWGARDPYFGVLTNSRYRASVLTEEGKAEFFEIGRQHVEHVLTVIRTHFEPTFAAQRVFDFGCGVGRLVIPFASVAETVLGMDISRSMLEEAARNCEALGIGNARLVMSDDQLSSADGVFDLVHTCIVLQHIEIHRGRELFSRLVRKIRSGGYGAIHVTFAWDAHPETYGQIPPTPVVPPPSVWALIKQTVKSSLGLSPPERKDLPAPVNPDPDPEMQMNYYNLSELMFVLQRAGVQQVHTEMTDHGGALGAFLFFRIPPELTPAGG